MGPEPRPALLAAGNDFQRVVVGNQIAFLAQVVFQAEGLALVAGGVLLNAPVAVHQHFQPIEAIAGRQVVAHPQVRPQIGQFTLAVAVALVELAAIIVAAADFIAVNFRPVAV